MAHLNKSCPHVDVVHVIIPDGELLPSALHSLLSNSVS
jgi:hypothetical protein